MTEHCSLWNVKRTHTTPYHYLANGNVERNDRLLGDSLRALLVKEGEEEWDKLLPQLMRTYRASPHTTTGETAHVLMFGTEFKIPD